MTVDNVTLSAIHKLPAPPTDKFGWPWDERVQRLPALMPNGDAWPKITLVTPNYNYGDFLEETIRSVLLQGYPNLEFIVLDGGSTDDSVSVIKKYEKWITYWHSEPDNGQANAINKGLALTTGDWFNWLNSDDILMPCALETLAKISQMVPEAKWISGGRIDLTATGEYADTCIPWRTDPSNIALGTIFLPQDATFIKTDFLNQHNVSLSEQCTVVFDTVLYYELLQHTKPILTSAILSGMRYHDSNKTTHSGKLKEEYQQFIQPFIQRYSWYRRGFHRLLKTRFHRLVYAALLYITRKKWIPYACDWQAVLLDREKGSFKQVLASQALYGLGHID